MRGLVPQYDCDRWRIINVPTAVHICREAFMLAGSLVHGTSAKLYVQVSSPCSRVDIDSNVVEQ